MRNRPQDALNVLDRPSRARDAGRAVRSAPRSRGILLCAVVAAIVAMPQAAVAWEEEARLAASDPLENAELGFDVALSADGNTALVGAPGAALNGNDFQGAAYVYTRVDGAWSEQAKLVASDGGQWDTLGTSVALSDDGDLAVVGAGLYPSGLMRGAAYVFARADGVWTEQAKLMASDGEDLDGFGWSVAMSGETILVGLDIPLGDKAGAVYVFDRVGDTWVESAKLTASDGFPGDDFGFSVALSGDTAIIGMSGALPDSGGNPRGAVHVFSRDGGTWNESAILTASDATDFDAFGWSVAYADDILVVGALGDNDAQGSAYVFHHDAGTWSEEAKLVASDGVAEQAFGIDVAVSGDTVVVGTLPLADTISNAAYVFARDGDTWSEAMKLVSPDGQIGDGFGDRVAVAGATALVGEYRDEVDGVENAGAAHVYVRGQGAELSFEPANLVFGDVEVGTSSAPQSAMLLNTGSVDATGIVFSGLPDAGFAADTSACGDILPAGGSCAVSVTFTPAAPGAATAALHVESAEGATADLALAGNGVGGNEGPVADITPGSFAFEAPQGGSDAGTLSIGNSGDADLTWSLEESGTAAATAFVQAGAPYAYGLAGAPEFHAPVGFDRASGVTRSRGEAPADAIVLPAPQPAAIGELAEGFDDIGELPGAGWALINNSEPVGPSSWFQGNETIFPAHEGEPGAYIAANFESVDGVGTISNWLITPEVTIVNGTTVTFWTRKAELFAEFADRIEVRMSVAGDSTDVGGTADSVGDFTEVLLTINPDLIPGEYPQEWTQFTLTVRGRSRRPATGRFAFRYFVTDAGPNGTNADYIGIDTVSVTQPGGPQPSGCDNPADVPWLAADPASGTTAPGASEPVNVAVDATGLEVGDYTARLCVTTNDPNASLVEIPVQLTVSAAGGRRSTDMLSAAPSFGSTRHTP